MILHDLRRSGNSYKVRLVMAHLGLDYERRVLTPEEYADRSLALAGLNPIRKVPTLVLGDGRAIPESGAIIWYLARGTHLVPDDPYDQARMLGWMMFEQYEILPTIARLRFLRHFEPHPERFAGSVADRAEGARQALQALEEHLSGSPGFLVGDALTLADIAVYAYTHMAHEADVHLTPFPAVRAWHDRVASHPRHIPITA